MNLPVISDDKPRMTEQEARVVGHVATRLPQLRYLLGESQAENQGGKLTVGNLSAVATLTKEDTQAVLSLLIERDSLFLASFNIDVEGETT